MVGGKLAEMNIKTTFHSCRGILLQSWVKIIVGYFCFEHVLFDKAGSFLFKTEIWEKLPVNVCH